jgi:hypothetical protein
MRTATMPANTPGLGFDEGTLSAGIGPSGLGIQVKVIFPEVVAKIQVGP